MVPVCRVCRVFNSSCQEHWLPSEEACVLSDALCKQPRLYKMLPRLVYGGLTRRCNAQRTETNTAFAMLVSRRATAPASFAQDLLRLNSVRAAGPRPLPPGLWMRGGRVVQFFGGRGSSRSCRSALQFNACMRRRACDGTPTMGWRQSSGIVF